MLIYSFCRRIFNQCAFFAAEKHGISRNHCETEAVSGTIGKEKMYGTLCCGKRLLLMNLLFAPFIRKGNDQ